jgi:hypothetical protein
VLLKHGRHTRVASCRTAAPGHISGAPLLLCSRTNGPQPACAWSVALHTHAPTETNRAGRQSGVARRTRVALLLPRPPHRWRKLVVPGCTAALSHLVHQALRIRPPRAIAQLLLPNSPRHICHLCLCEGRDLPESGPRLPLPSAPSCHAAAPPHTRACAFQHREPRTQARADHPATHRRSLRRSSTLLATRHIRSSACCDAIRAKVRPHRGRALRGRLR